MKAIVRVTLAVHRKTTLSTEEEEVKCKLTWQDHDWMQYVCSLDEEELKKKVAGSEEWMKNLHRFEIEYEDEVGLWIGLEQTKTTVTEEEQKQMLERKKLHSKNPDDHAAIEEEEQKAGGGQTQTRGPEGKSEDKRRITILHRMFLQNTVQMEGRRLKPQGVLGRTVLVLPGVHCCADFFDFIDGEAVWNRNWSVEYQGTLKEYII